MYMGGASSQWVVPPLSWWSWVLEESSDWVATLLPSQCWHWTKGDYGPRSHEEQASNQHFSITSVPTHASSPCSDFPWWQGVVWNCELSFPRCLWSWSFIIATEIITRTDGPPHTLCGPGDLNFGPRCCMASKFFIYWCRTVAQMVLSIPSSFGGSGMQGLAHARQAHCSCLVSVAYSVFL